MRLLSTIKLSFFFKKTLFLVLIAAGLSIGAAVFVRAQEIPKEPTESQLAASGIVFPVAELGNCENKAECKTYCNDPSHMPECIAFAKKHGLMNEKEATRAEKFHSEIVSGGGPGGCKTPKECRDFCENIGNIEACVAFVDKGSIGDDSKHLAEARKIIKYIKSGGQMPGGCTSKESCENYCGDFSHADECLAFMEKSGVGPGNGEGERGPKGPDEFRKFIELAKSGATPGGCKSKNECEAYCGGGEHFEECVAFGEKMGFVKPDEAEMIRKTGGKGPGGCNSEHSCRDYCNDPANQDLCFKFGEEHGLISKEDLKGAKDGLVRMRQGLEQTPPEVAACLKTKLGPDVIEKIQAGTLTPGPRIGEEMRQCFDKFGHRFDPREAFEKMPLEMLQCVKDKFGGDFEKLRSGEIEFTPEKGDVFRVCGEEMKLKIGGFFDEHGAGGPDGENENNPEERKRGGERMSDFFQSAPPGVVQCLSGELGDRFPALKSGSIQVDSEIGSTIKKCFESFKPDDSRRYGPPGGSDDEKESHPEGNNAFPLGDPFSPGENRNGAGLQGNEFGGNPNDLENAPAEIKDCVKSSSGTSDPQKTKELIQNCIQKFKDSFKFGEGQMPKTQPYPGQGNFGNYGGEHLNPGGTYPSGAYPPPYPDKNYGSIPLPGVTSPSTPPPSPTNQEPVKEGLLIKIIKLFLGRR